jgi:hypothetical protein
MAITVEFTEEQAEALADGLENATGISAQTDAWREAKAIVDAAVASGDAASGSKAKAAPAKPEAE